MPRPYKDPSNPPRLGRRVGARCVFLRDVVGIIVTGRGIVPLELFTNRARHASPLQRFIEPTAPGMPRRRPLRFLQGIVGITYGDHLRKSASSAVRDSPLLSDGRSQQSGSVVVNLEVLTNRARHASPLQRSIEPTAPGMSPRRPLRSSAGVITIIWGNLGNPGLGAPACLTFVVDDRSLWSKIVVDQAL